MSRESRFATRFGLAIGIWALAFVAGIVLQGCDSGGTITGPTTTTTTSTPIAAAPAPSPTATPTAVDPTPTPRGFELTFGPGACFSVKNTGAVPAGLESWYTSFDNQDLAFDTQPHAIQPGATAERCFARECIQVDVDQPGVKLVGFAFFDKGQKPFNPSSNPEKVAECRTKPCIEEWRELEPEYTEWADYIQAEAFSAATVAQVCYKDQRRKKTVREQNSCTKETRIKAETTETREVETPCPCLYPEPTSSIAPLTYPAIGGYAYYQMNQGNDTARENACEGRGGTWLNDYNIPDDGEGTRSNVCRFPFLLPPGAPGADVTLLHKAPTGGNPISGSASVGGAGTWKLVLRATSPGNYEKDTDSVTLTCNDQKRTLSVSYNWVGHGSENWKLELYRNNVLVGTSATVTNPTN